MRNFLVSSSLFLVACGGPKAPDLTQTLQALVDSTVAATPSIPGLILRVQAPSLGLDWQGAAGVFDRATGEKLRPEHTMRIASNTKTYIAAATLRLVEDGKVGLDDPIAKHLSPESLAELRRDGYDTEAITVRHLLTHTSGIFDYAMSPEFAAAVGADFSHRWTRPEQLTFAIDKGAPYGKPGEVYHYSDTGYILLGELLERTTGQTMGAAVAALIGYQKLGLTHTYFESLDSVPAGTPARAHQYLDGTDSYGLDASHDLYGGGGIVTNLADLTRFYRALVRGEILLKPGLLEVMLTPSAPSLGPDSTSGYGMGIGRGRVGTELCYGHSGYWGTTARYCPAADVTVAAAMNRSPDSLNAGGQVARRALELVLAAVKK